MSGGPALYPSSGASSGSSAHVVLVTGPDRDTLAALGRAVVEERLAACANVLGGVTSVYRWRGEVVEEGEAMALLKTTEARLDALRKRVCELHPYDTPEFVALRVDTGSADYLSWIDQAVSEG